MNIGLHKHSGNNYHHLFINRWGLLFNDFNIIKSRLICYLASETKSKSETMQKLLTLVAALFLLCNISTAQFYKKIMPGNNISAAVASITENFQNNYHRIQGDELPADEGREIYRSTVTVPGASHAVIYRFHSKEDTTASFQAILYEGESYKEAAKIYKQTFRQVKGTKFNGGAEKISFDGSMEEPTEELRFTSSRLRPDVTAGAYKNFIAEVELINSVDGWKVQLNLHSRKNDEERY